MTPEGAFKITPRVNEAFEFLEISNDFTDPLEVIREAISNSADHGARLITIRLQVRKERQKDKSYIFIEDDGIGMNEDRLQAFFDLGYSTSRDKDGAIGEKGHGTKVFFNSEEIIVETSEGKGYPLYEVHLIDPIGSLTEGAIPSADGKKYLNETDWHGTRIIIKGYNDNRCECFAHEQVKDYVLWFTLFGSVEAQFDVHEHKDLRLLLKGVDKKETDEFEEIPFGHVFPDEEFNVDTLWDKYGTQAGKYYVKKWVYQDTLPSSPDKQFQAVFYFEGDYAKRSYNKMLRWPSRRDIPKGAYPARDRYGLWLCKDFIPIENKSEWLNIKGTEFVRFHAFFNLQEFSLTANRGSVANTSPVVMKDVALAVGNIYSEIQNDDDYQLLDEIEDEVVATKTKEQEKRDFEKRVKRSEHTKVAEYKGHVFFEPVRDGKFPSEQAVFTLFVQLKLVDPDLFPFEIIDYDTHRGIDVIGRAPTEHTVSNTRLYYIEFKGMFEAKLNHSFKYLESIVCWDTDLQHGSQVEDLARAKRTLKIAPATDEPGSYTKYFLDSDREDKKIEVFVLRHYLPERGNIVFRPR